MFLNPQLGDITAHCENPPYPPGRQQAFIPVTQTAEAPILQQVVTERPSCSVCFKTFVDKSGLNRHRLTRKITSCLDLLYDDQRTNRLGLPCESCGKIFSRQDTLQRHSNIKHR